MSMIGANMDPELTYMKLDYHASDLIEEAHDMLSNARMYKMDVQRSMDYDKDFAASKQEEIDLLGRVLEILDMVIYGS